MKKPVIEFRKNEKYCRYNGQLMTKKNMIAMFGTHEEIHMSQNGFCQVGKVLYCTDFKNYLNIVKTILLKSAKPISVGNMTQMLGNDMTKSANAFLPVKIVENLLSWKEVRPYEQLEKDIKIKELTKFWNALSKFNKEYIEKVREDIAINGMPQSFPSQEFAKKTKMHELYTEWKMPDGYDNRSFAKLLSENRSLSKILNRVVPVIENLLARNPDLLRIDHSSIEEKLNIAWGALSKFNVDDIGFYVAMNKQGFLRMYNLSNRNTVNQIEKKAKIPVQWVMSPKTMKSVCAKYGVKYIEVIKLPDIFDKWK